MAALFVPGWIEIVLFEETVHHYNANVPNGYAAAVRKRWCNDLQGHSGKKRELEKPKRTLT